MSLFFLSICQVDTFTIAPKTIISTRTSFIFALFLTEALHLVECLEQTRHSRKKGRGRKEVRKTGKGGGKGVKGGRNKGRREGREEGDEGRKQNEKKEKRKGEREEKTRKDNFRKDFFPAILLLFKIINSGYIKVSSSTIFISQNANTTQISIF